ncbi:KNTase domain-containing protein [Paenalkalicoccus suaedae]|uniref:KNTase domain-containing protein n=1 Tax=Paenalkalicoccus suaedae TaxID=2592382 RepID=A0A859FAL4_9BACI|nr:kanamycin nucleotidyltransferase C-terminal domain-containing protein [Paenalkalicoccus suaedae]QKS69960.1 KNTase domain-containing protein [Paenalkalicoccus suaedae]
MKKETIKLNYPQETTREAKLQRAQELAQRVQDTYGDAIVAIGLYGSLATGRDGGYSDIEMHVVARDEVEIPAVEGVYPPYKIELSMRQETSFLKEASIISDAWSVKAGSYVDVRPLYDPTDYFKNLKKMPFKRLSEQKLAVMREFFIWEPCETIAKLYTNWDLGNQDYVIMAAHDLLWQTAKLIGLANETYYPSRATMLRDATSMSNVPKGFDELVTSYLSGDMADKQAVYLACKNLWEGLQKWISEQGITYTEDVLTLPSIQTKGES